MRNARPQVLRPAEGDWLRRAMMDRKVAFSAGAKPDRRAIRWRTYVRCRRGKRTTRSPANANRSTKWRAAAVAMKHSVARVISPPEVCRAQRQYRFQLSVGNGFWDRIQHDGK